MLQKLIKNKLGFSFSSAIKEEETKRQDKHKNSGLLKNLQTEHIESSQKVLRSQRNQQKFIQTKKKSKEKIQLPKITKINESLSNQNNSIKQKLNTSSLISSRSSKRSSARSYKRSPLIINITNTHYPVIQKVANQLNFKIVDSYAFKKWDIKWCDNAITTETLAKMNKNQRINHFPGMSTIARKNQLVININKMKSQFPQQYDFTPRTFLIPKDHSKLVKYDKDSRKKGLLKTYIVKPEASCQGRGIYLTQSIQQIPSNQPFVVQKYVINPLLYKGLKFDLRIYALITSCYPLVLYVYNEGLVRLATENYEFPSSYNLENFCMHLTNYAINKENPNYMFNQSLYNLTHGHKKSLAQFFKELKSMNFPVHKYWSEIKDCITKTVISGVPHLTKQYKVGQPKSQKSKMCFQILGFDFMMDTNGKVYLLQVNHTPALTTDTPLDLLIKSSLVKDTLKIIQNSNWSYEQVNSSRQSQKQQKFGSYSQIFPTKNKSIQKKYQAMLNYCFSLQQSQQIRNKIQRYIPISISKTNKIARTYTEPTNKKVSDNKKLNLVQSLQPLNNKFQVFVQFKSKQVKPQNKSSQFLQKRSSRSSSSNNNNIRNSKSSLLISLDKLQRMKSMSSKSIKNGIYKSSRSLITQSLPKQKEKNILQNKIDKNIGFSKIKMKKIVDNLKQDSQQNQVAYSDRNLNQNYLDQIQNIKREQKIKQKQKQLKTEKNRKSRSYDKGKGQSKDQKVQKQQQKSKHGNEEQQKSVKKCKQKEYHEGIRNENYNEKPSNLNMNFNINVNVKLSQKKIKARQVKSTKNKPKIDHKKTKFQIQLNLKEQLNKKLITQDKQTQMPTNKQNEQAKQANYKEDKQDKQDIEKITIQKSELNQFLKQQEKKTKMENQLEFLKDKKNKQKQKIFKYAFNQALVKDFENHSSDQKEYQHQVFQQSKYFVEKTQKITINKYKNKGSNNSKLFSSFE